MSDERSDAHSARLEQAVAWHGRLADADEATWAAFTVWLEAHPDNRLAFDRVEDVDAKLSGPDIRQSDWRAPLLEFARPKARPSRLLPWVAGAALAAASLLLVIRMQEGQPSALVYETGFGETKTIALSDGTKIALNANTRITVAPTGRHVTLGRGEVLFRVVHDAANPFIVTVGDQDVRDVGTVFDVARGNGTTTVTVAEGRVGVQPVIAGHKPILLSAGEQLVRADGARQSVVIRVDPETVLAWREGYLVYRDTPLSQVVADLNRYFPSPIMLASDEVGALKFSGALKIDNEDAVLRRISQFLPVTIERGDGRKITLRMAITHR